MLMESIKRCSLNHVCVGWGLGVGVGEGDGEERGMRELRKIRRDKRITMIK